MSKLLTMAPLLRADVNLTVNLSRHPQIRVAGFILPWAVENITDLIENLNLPEMLQLSLNQSVHC